MASLTAASGVGTLKEGPLDKLGHLVKNWKNRFFVLETRVNGTNIDPWIVYYRGSGVGKSEGAKGQLCLVGAKVFRPAQDDPADKYFNFEIETADGKPGLKLRATVPENRSEWLTAIDAAIQAARPVVEVLATKKGTIEKATVRQQSAHASSSSFKARYFELEKRTSSLGVEAFVVYYTDFLKKEIKGAVSLAEATAARPDRADPSDPHFPFTVSFRDGRVMDLRCTTAAERDEWCEAFGAAAATCAVTAAAGGDAADVTGDEDPADQEPAEAASADA